MTQMPGSNKLHIAPTDLYTARVDLQAYKSLFAKLLFQPFSCHKFLGESLDLCTDSVGVVFRKDFPSCPTTCWRDRASINHDLRICEEMALRASAEGVRHRRDLFSPHIRVNGSKRADVVLVLIFRDPWPLWRLTQVCLNVLAKSQLHFADRFFLLAKNFRLLPWR